MVLTFLWETKVGKMITLAPVDAEWEELEGIELWPRGRGGSG